jgi:gluconokinase
LQSGHPPDERDRWPWLEKIAALIDRWRQLGTPGVIPCAALRRSYRDFLTDGRPEVRVVYLRADRTLLASRQAAGKGSLRPPSLLDSQLGILEEPDPDENSIRVDVSHPIEDVVADILRAGHHARLREKRNWGESVFRPGTYPSWGPSVPSWASVSFIGPPFG